MTSKEHLIVEKEQFATTMQAYQDRVNMAVNIYASEIMNEAEEYGEFISLPIEACTNILTAPAKRTRGVLTIAGYELLGGSDNELIDRASATVEALQTYLLVIDDMQDNSRQRRNRLPAHIYVEDELFLGSTSAPKEVASSVTLNGALILGHHALKTLGSLPNSPSLARNRAQEAINMSMLPTGFGQTGDLLAPYTAEISDEEANKANGDKTKHYTFRAPLEVGMHLAGASTSDIEAIQEFASNLGEAYQLQNDMEVLDTTVDGKDRGDDIRSGKRTIILQYALSDDSKLNFAQKQYLRERVGDQKLSNGEVMQCQSFLAESGAGEVMNRIIDYKVTAGIESLDKGSELSWRAEQRQFLQNIGRLMLSRTS